MRVQVIRHATLMLYINNLKILVDPVFSPAGAMATIANSTNQLLNPLVELPVGIGELINVDAILVTHTHRDHFDQQAAEILPKHIQVFCQPEDEEKIKTYGFEKVTAVTEKFFWKDITFTRTQGRHGTGENEKILAPVSGFIVQAEGEPSLYIAGDTVWCDYVEDTLKRFNPQITLVFAGAAQFLTGGPITMTGEDIQKVCQCCQDTQVFVAHMEAWNHCPLTRSTLRAFFKEKGLEKRVFIPEDGQEIVVKLSS